MKEYFQDITTKKAILIILAIGAVVFSNTLVNGFVGDDNSQIVYNNSIRSFFDVSAYFKGNFYSVGENFNTVNYYRPLMYVAYTFIGEIFGLSPFFFHLFVAGLHITNAVLLFLFLRRFILNQGVVLIMALIFLVHPMNGEVAVYVANIQDSLFFFFGLLALLKISQKENLTIVRLVGVHFLLLGSLLSKETGVVFLLLVPLCSFLFDKKEFVKLSIVSLAVSLEYILLRFVVADFFLSKSMVAISPMINFSLGERILHIPAILLYYLKTFIWPLKLAIFQVWTIQQIDFYNFYFPLGIVTIFFGWMFLLGKGIYASHGREVFSIYIFFVVWFILGLIPHIQFFPIDGTVADRWFYLSSVGLLVILIFAYYEYAKTERIKNIAIAFSLLAVMFYGARTIERNMDWKDDITLTSHDVMINPDSYILNSAYGSILQSRKEYGKAQSFLEKAVQSRSDVVAYRMLLGVNLNKLGRLEEAKKQYFEADKIAPESSIAASYYSSSLLSQGKYDEAEAYANLVFSRQDVNDPYSPMILAVLEYRKGNSDKAIDLLMQSANESPKLLAKDLFWKIKKNESIPDGYILEKLLEIY